MRNAIKSTFKLFVMSIIVSAMYLTMTEMYTYQSRIAELEKISSAQVQTIEALSAELSVTKVELAQSEKAKELLQKRIDVALIPESTLREAIQVHVVSPTQAHAADAASFMRTKIEAVRQHDYKEDLKGFISSLKSLM